jgi:hypothetical protein
MSEAGLYEKEGGSKANLGNSNPAGLANIPDDHVHDV